MAAKKVAMISSTIHDLLDHRQKVLNACLRQDVMPSMLEHWPAEDINGITNSLRKVDEADIYIGVFAHRYGYIPKGKSISITEMEYEQATKRGIPRLIFLIDEDHDIKISQVEIATARNLGELKQKLKKECVVSFFKSPDDLAAKVIQSLSKLNLYPDRSGENVAQSITGAVPSFDPNNYIFYVPYRSKGDQVLGRDEALRSVRSQLVGGRRTAIGQTASFQGLGGLGKTQLAVEYAYRFRDQYPNGVIFLNADQDIDAQLINIAEKAKWVAAEAEHRDKLSISQQRLRTRSHCLIIFDNLDNAEIIQSYLPEPEAEPHILVTSRTDHPNFVPVPIELLDGELSVRLLTQEAGQAPSTHEEKVAAAEIAAKLGGLPLALELAGAYLRHRPIGWVRYRELLNENLKSALPSRFLAASFTRHETDLYSTLKISDEFIAGEPLLNGILDILTWSGPSAMEQSLLYCLLDGNQSAEGAAALSLGVALRLIQKTPNTERYTLHRLVREVRREDIPLAGRKDWAINISERLASWFQTLKRKFSDLPQFEAETEHLKAWQENVHGLSPKLASRLMWLQAYPPFHRGRFNDSHALLKKAKDLLGLAENEDSELKADLLSDLCTICTNIGDISEGRKCGEEALAIRLKLFGENHSETAMTFHNLACNVQVLGEMEAKSQDLQKALEYAERALEIWQAINGKDHIDTALALDGMSQIYRCLGKNGEALNFAEQAFSVREKVLGLMNPDTIMSLNNLGRIYTILEKYPVALQYQERALKIAEQLFGMRSPLRAVALNNLGVIYFKLKDYTKSLTHEHEALALRKELFGSHHPGIPIIANNIVNCFLEMRRGNAAIQFLEELLKSTPKDAVFYDDLKRKNRELQVRFPRPGFRQPPRNKR